MVEGDQDTPTWKFTQYGLLFLSVGEIIGIPGSFYTLHPSLCRNGVSLQVEKNTLLRKLETFADSDYQVFW